MTGKPFAAEVLFLNPDDVPHAARALAGAGYAFKADYDAIDEHGPTIFGFVTGTTELSEVEVGHAVFHIIWPLGGDVVEWGYGAPWKISE